MFTLKRTRNRLFAGLVAATLWSGAAESAVVLSDAFDGNWYNPQQNGRGLLVDFIPTGADRGVFFGALFTYDNNGQPLWLTVQTDVIEGEFAKSGIQVSKVTGGSFGNVFSAPTVGSIGSANLTINHCNSLTLEITPTAQSGLPPVNLQLQPTIPTSSEKCAYQRSFTSCSAGTTPIASAPRTCALSGMVTQNLTLTNEATYVLQGKVEIGGRDNTSPARLTIEPGTRVIGSGGGIDYLVINPSSKIFAEGQATAPIVFTGPTPVPGSWAGLFIAGNAPVNCGAPCAFEADANIKFGGNNATESSGTLRYVHIRYAGQVVAQDRELNGLTLGGVGSGTLIDYVQVHAGKDDGIEAFGGTVNMSHLVLTDNEDDSLDFDFGYKGKIQHALIKLGANSNNDSRGIESDNHPQSFDLQPRTQPVVSNVTIIGHANADEGIRLRRGSGGNYTNIVVTGFPAECLNFNDNATFNASGTPAAPASTGVLTMTNSFLSCNTNFEDSGSEPFLVSAWYGSAQSGNAVGNAMLNGIYPQAGSPLLGSGQTPADAYFEITNAKGAFTTTSGNWVTAWIAPGTL